MHAKSVKNGSNGIVVVSRDQVRRMIDTEARARMGMSGEEFLRRWEAHELPDTLEANDIGIFAGLLGASPSAPLIG